MANKRKRRKTLGLEILDYTVTLAVVIALVLIANRFLIINARIPSASMANTIHEGDRIFGNRIAYRDRTPERYDIIIFPFPDDRTGKTLYIKRVIGLPGEIVNIRDGKVYINGGSEPLDDSFCPEPPEGNFGPYEVPEGKLFVLGDNRSVSDDSRFWENPYIPQDSVMGKAFFRYWPLTRIGAIE